VDGGVWSTGGKILLRRKSLLEDGERGAKKSKGGAGPDEAVPLRRSALETGKNFLEFHPALLRHARDEQRSELDPQKNVAFSGKSDRLWRGERDKLGTGGHRVASIELKGLRFQVLSILEYLSKNWDEK